MRFLTLLFLIFTISSYASIGYISALRGDVFVERDGERSKAFKGFQLENKDIINTSRRSKAQFIFKDKTVIRVGQNSNFEISDYLFDKTKKSKAKFRVRSGFFSAVTGKIGKISKNRFKLKTRNSTIGIRGTHFQGLIRENSEDIACLKGSIFVEIEGKSIDVMAGEVLNIKAGIPSTPKKLKVASLKNMEKKIVEEQNTPETASFKYETLLTQYFTKTELLKSENGLVVLDVYTQKQPLAQSLESIQEAKPLDVSITADRTSLSSDIFSSKSWDGNSEGGKILKYSGDIIFVGDLSEENSNILTNNGIQTVNIMLDTTNSFATGDFKYLDNTVIFSSSGNGAVTQDGFLYFSNNVLTGENRSRIIFPEQGGYFAGDNIYAKIGITKPDFFDVDEEGKLDSKIVTGGFIASKTEEIAIAKKEIDSNDIFVWGYWAYQEDDAEKLRGAWIKTDVTVTSKEKIAEFKEKSVKASYSGEVFGTVENYLTGTEAKKIKDGTFNIEFDFMANKTDAGIRFETNTQKYGIEFTAKDIIKDDGTFAFKKSSSTISNGTFEMKENSISKPEYMYGSGEFIGENAENIVGGFTAGFKNGDIAITGFKGEK